MIQAEYEVRAFLNLAAPLRQQKEKAMLLFVSQSSIGWSEECRNQS